jgi:hypothetical protein
VAEWLRNGLQNRVPRFNSGRGLHKINDLESFHFSHKTCVSVSAVIRDKAKTRFPLVLIRALPRAPLWGIEVAELSLADGSEDDPVAEGLAVSGCDRFQQR